MFANIDARLFPEERDGTANLQKRAFLLLENHHLLRFDKVGHIAFVLKIYRIVTRNLNKLGTLIPRTLNRVPTYSQLSREMRATWMSLLVFGFGY
jgi:hypothetical protein